MSETIPFTEAKAHLSDLVDRTSREHERFVVTRNGRPAAVLLSPEDLESLEETVDVLQDRALLDSIRKSRREAAEGKRLRLKDHLQVTYEVEITPEGLRHLNRPPDKVRAAVVETIFGTIAENPLRAGKPLRGELEGLYSARRGEFRVIYEIDDAARVVIVHRAQHRRSSYRRRQCHRLEIAAAPETVWAVMTDLPGWPAWSSDVKSMVVEGPIAPGSVFRWKAGSASLVSTLKVVEAPREIGWTGKTMGIHAVPVFRFEPVDGGALARSAESFRGLIPSVLKKYSRNVLRRGIDRILSALKIEAERRAAAGGD